MPNEMKIRSEQKAFAILGGRTEQDGEPVQRFRKEIMRIGEYVLEEMEFDITAEVIQHWAVMFAQMNANGIKIPIPNKHDTSGDPDNNRGWVVDMFVDDDVLVMVCDLIGDDAIKAASRCDVSIFSPPEFKDGKGHIYKQPITHVALVTDPAIPGLGEFVSIAASREWENKTMKWVNIGKALGIKDDLTAETAEKLICASVTSLQEVAESQDELVKAQAKELKTLKAAPKNPPKNELAVPDAMLLSLARDNRTMKLDALVEAARITPAVRDKLAEQFIGKDCEALTLSLQHGTSGVFDNVVAALADNDVVELKAKSGPQVLKLHRDDGKTPNAIVEDAERRAKAASTK